MENQTIKNRVDNQDRYISYEAALFLRDCFNPMIYVMEYATCNSKKENTDAEIYNQIPTNHFFGFGKMNGLVVAEPEKALLDIIYRNSKRNYSVDDILDEVDWDMLDLEKLDKYSKKMGFDWKAYLPTELPDHPNYRELAEIISK